MSFFLIPQQNWAIKALRLSEQVVQQIPKSMKLSVLALFCSAGIAWSAESYAQEAKVSLNAQNETVQTVLNEIEDQSDFSFFFNVRHIDLDRRVSLSVEESDVFNVLDKIFAGTDVTYKVLDRKIILTKAEGKASQQNGHTVTGKVVDKNGEPIIGANIVVKGTNNGTITDVDGNFTLVAPDNARLVVSYIGYLTQEVSINNQHELSVFLEEDSQALNEVVFVGYGAQKKVNLTGAVNVVSDKDLKDRQATTVSQLLQGTSPGMNFSISGENGFEPGASMNISIRGMGSLNGGSPYVVIDGFPGDLNNLNPEDIESISILKDAASSAIYGAKAPYGVILVTTKKGKKNQKVSVSYTGNLIIKTAQNIPTGLDSYTYTKILNEAGDNRGGHPFSNETIDRVIAFQKGDFDFIRKSIPNYPAGAKITGAMPEGDVWNNANLNFANTDWWDIYFGHSINQKHDLYVQGGSDKVSYYVSAGYIDDGSVINFGTDNYQRINTLGKINIAITDWWDINYENRFAKKIREKPNMTKEGDYSFMFRHISRNYPITPLYDGFGHYMFESHIPSMEAGTNRDDEIDMWNNFRTEIRPLKGWKINADFAYNVDLIETTNVDKNIWIYDLNNEPYAHGVGLPNGILRQKYTKKYWTTNIFSSYSFDIKDDHHFTVLAGMQFEKGNISYLQGYKSDLILDKIPSFQTATGTSRLWESLQHNATESFFARLNYDYHGRYLFEANVRRDGSYVFSNGKRWGTFPSFSAGWNANNESFWEPIAPVINTMKVRVSWGQLGNQNIAPYTDMQLMPISSGTVNWIYGYGSARPVGYTSTPGLVNHNLTWETSTTTDVGLDLSFLDGRLSATGDWFERRTTDMVGPATALPGVLGASVPKENNATLRTRGWEIGVNWKHTLPNGLSYNVGASLYDYRSVVTKYNNPTGTLSTWYEGAEVGEIWGYTVKDLFRTKKEVDDYLSRVDLSHIAAYWQTGDVKYEDINDDGKVNNGKNTVDDHGDYSIIGNTEPHFQYTINCSASWKGFDFSMLWKGVAKKDIYFASGSNMFWGFMPGWWESCLTPEHLDYFRDQPGTTYSGLYEGEANINTDAYFPRPYLNYSEDQKNKAYPNTRYLQNGAYLRLQNLQLGYSLPKKVISKMHLEKFRIYFSGENLVTFSHMPKGVDPIAPVGFGTGGNFYGGGAVGRMTYGADRVFSFGVTITY